MSGRDPMTAFLFAALAALIIALDYFLVSDRVARDTFYLVGSIAAVGAVMALLPKGRG